MIKFILIFYIFIYLFLTKKIFIQNICNSNITKITKFSIINIIFLNIFSYYLISFFIDKNIILFFIFYFLFFDLILIKVRLELLRIFIFFSKKGFKKFSYKFVFSKKMGSSMFIFFYRIEKILRKAYIIILPISLYFFDSQIFFYINFLILISMKYRDFEFEVEKILLNNYLDQKIYLTIEGNIKVNNYKKSLICNIIRFNSKNFLPLKLVWGIDFFYFSPIFNEIEKREQNLL